jgi:hypothetical protein
MSPFYLIYIKKERLQIILHGNDPYVNTQHDIWHTYMHLCVPMVIVQARRKKHRMEHNPSEILKAHMEDVVVCFLTFP